MAIELPDEVVTFLSIIGINWPTVNEDKVREFASHIREFADNVEAAHRDSTATIHSLGEAYQGPRTRLCWPSGPRCRTVTSTTWCRPARWWRPRWTWRRT